MMRLKKEAPCAARNGTVELETDDGAVFGLPWCCFMRRDRLSWLGCTPWLGPPPRLTRLRPPTVDRGPLTLDRRAWTVDRGPLTAAGTLEVFRCEASLAAGALAAVVSFASAAAPGGPPVTWLFCPDPLCMASKPHATELPAWCVRREGQAEGGAPSCAHELLPPGCGAARTGRTVPVNEASRNPSALFLCFPLLRSSCCPQARQDRAGQRRQGHARGVRAPQEPGAGRHAAFKGRGRSRHLTRRARRQWPRPRQPPDALRPTRPVTGGASPRSLRSSVECGEGQAGEERACGCLTERMGRGASGAWLGWLPVACAGRLLE